MTESDKVYPLRDATVVMPRQQTGSRQRNRMLGRRMRLAGALNRLIRLTCGFFATVLVVHSGLVLARANFDNAFAALIRDVATWASFGLRDLFTVDDRALRIALGEGAAALLWLVIAWALTNVLAQVLVPEVWQPMLRRFRR